MAIEENKPKIVELLIKEGKANIYGYYNGEDFEKYPIYCAVKNKNLNIVISIVEPIVLIGLLVLSTAFIVDASSNSFLYFRF